MKRMIALLLMMALMITAFAGCAPSTCESCGRTDVKTTKVEIDGESAYVCNVCEKIVNGANALSDALSGLDF